MMNTELVGFGVPMSPREGEGPIDPIGGVS
jgi:hypothetical protein